ncbi:hypothetical protein KUTeg_000323 [Tegillarca granosa]|uniref:ATPase V1 complex subunit H C-terminal domain-containing protein n=1 Tax=Tegillarca granosa TaxID=220873 RepID=A0ABQ9G0N0_TEGGR|nr:hypothetical protein KUTeg_000323 [Tegillarca granosa]
MANLETIGSVIGNIDDIEKVIIGQMISHEDYNFISKFDNANSDQRKAVLKDNYLQFAKTFFNLMSHIAKDQTLQYILTILDDVLQEDKSRVEIFKEYARRNKESVWAPFLHLLNRNDRFIVNQTSRIIAKIACWSKEPMGTEDLKFYLNWLKDQLRLPLTFCLWCLTFNLAIAEKMNKYNIIPILADNLSESAKEKNLLEKPTEREIIQDHALAMVQCKVLKQLELLEARKFDDPDIVDDLQFLTEKLQESVQDLSSFDEYSSEVKSGRLEWSPVHKSERFWRENAIRLNEKNYELLKILVRLLESSKDPLILSVAAHDLGEYLGGKQLVMQYLAHEDPNVRFEALIAVQKLMVHNWEYLGRQLEKTEPSNDKPSSLVPAKA